MEDKHRILIVDDSPANIKVLKNLLIETYHISIATSGADALEVVEQQIPDLILLDVMMPEMDGYEVCRQLKNNENTAKIPIIFVTARSEEGDEQLGLSLGAVDYISKPFSLPITETRIKNHLELKAARDNLQGLVEKKTKELCLANKKLSKQIKELQGRDQLVSLQTSGASLDEAGAEICRIIIDVIEAKQVILFSLDTISTELIPQILYDPTISNSIQFKEGIQKESICTSVQLAKQAMSERQLKQGASNNAAIPLCLQGEILGILWVSGINLDTSIGDNLDILQKLSNEAALVMRWAGINDDIVNNNINLNEIMGVL